MKKRWIFSFFLVTLITSLALLNQSETLVDVNRHEKQPTIEFNVTNKYVSSSTDTKTYDIAIPTTFEAMAQQGNLSLYLERETFAIAIKNNINGYVWFSYDVTRDYTQEQSDGLLTVEASNSIRSGIILKTYNVFNPGTRTMLDKDILGRKTTELTYLKTTSGFSATVDLTNVDIRFHVDVLLVDGSLVVQIPYDSIEEYSPTLWTPGNNDVILNEILVFPFFGASSYEENGYMVIPDGSGALVELKETPTFISNYSASIYGDDDGYEETPYLSFNDVDTVKPFARITLPIYGIVHEVDNAGMLVMSENGAEYGTFNFVSKGLLTPYYQSYFSYVYRTSYKQYQSRTNEGQHIISFQVEPNHFDIKQRYVFLDETANYVGIAKEYRQRLETQEVWTSKNETPFYKTHAQLIGNEVEQGIFFKENVPMSPYKDTLNLVQKLQTDGIANLAITYKTYLINNSQYRFDVLNELGGSTDYSTLSDYLAEAHISFEPFVDYTHQYEPTNSIAFRLNRTELMEPNQSYVYLYRYINDPGSFAGMVTSDLNLYQQYQVSSIAMSGFDDGLFTSTLDNREVQYATDNRNFIEESIDVLHANQLSTSFFNPDAYLFPYTLNYYDAPISSSELVFVDATIPLVSLVVSGYLPMYSPSLNGVLDETITLLRLLEYGILPSYTFTTEENYWLSRTNSSNLFISNYDYLKNRIQSNDAFIDEAMSIVGGLELTNHRFVSSGVVVSIYGNVSIYINYTSQQVEVDGVTIEPRGYAIDENQ